MCIRLDGPMVCSRAGGGDIGVDELLSLTWHSHCPALLAEGGKGAVASQGVYEVEEGFPGSRCTVAGAGPRTGEGHAGGRSELFPAQHRLVEGRSPWAATLGVRGCAQSGTAGNRGTDRSAHGINAHQERPTVTTTVGTAGYRHDSPH